MLQKFMDHRLGIFHPSYFTPPVRQFGREKYARLPFGAIPAGDIFQKTDQIFKMMTMVKTKTEWCAEYCKYV